MTEDQKQLLLKDLCSRLPYGVKMQKFNDPNIVIDLYAINLNNYTIDFYTYKGKSLTIANTSKLSRNDILLYKPYLFPLSSMTEEIMDEIYEVSGVYDIGIDSPVHIEIGTTFEDLIKIFHILNKHHIDYRGLIEKGLAIEAPEGMYN